MAAANRRELRQASIHIVEGHSLVIPLIIDGLPAEIDVLGRRWRRKREFHLTAVAARVLDGLADGRPDVWKRAVEVASGRWLGPVEVLDDVRRVTDPERPELQTLIVMARCPGIEELHDELSRALGVPLRSPPTHVTVYSTDPSRGIGIVDERELADRAPPLGETEQRQVRQAMGLPQWV